MSLGTDLRTLLTSHSALTALVSTRVSPYLRNRDDVFPAITYELQTEELTPSADGTVSKSEADAVVTVHARTFTECETIGTAVLGAISSVSPANTIRHVLPQSIERAYEEPYDGSQDLIYRWALNVHISGA